MSDTFQKMMAKFNQPVEPTQAAIKLRETLHELDESLLNLKSICKSPIQCLDSLNELGGILSENSQVYKQYRFLQDILKEDIKCIDMFIKTATVRNKTVTELVDFGVEGEDELLAISRLVSVCLKANIMQAQSCLKLNSSAFRLLRIIQTSI